MEKTMKNNSVDSVYVVRIKANHTLSLREGISIHNPSDYSITVRIFKTPEGKLEHKRQIKREEVNG